MQSPKSGRIHRGQDTQKGQCHPTSTNASIGLMKESQKHLRFQINVQTVSLQTLLGYFPDWMMISLCLEATETDSEIAKVKVR